MRKIRFVALPDGWEDNLILRGTINDHLAEIEREIEVEDNIQVVRPFTLGRLLCVDYKDGEAQVSFPLSIINTNLKPIQ